MSEWQPIETAPKEPVAPGWGCGPLIYLRPAWFQGDGSPNDWDVGCWNIREKCFRLSGDDGSNDDQPTHWMPLPPPPQDKP